MQRTVRHTLKIEATSDVTVDGVLNRISTHFRSKRNEVVDKLAFFKRVQKDGESFDAFFSDLQELMSVAHFVNTPEERLHTQVIAGLKNDEIRRLALSRVPALSMEDLATLVRAEEASRRDAATVVGESAFSVEAVSAYKRGKQQQQFSQFQQRKPSQGQQSQPRSDGKPRSCLLYTSPSPRDLSTSRMPSSA